MVDVTDSDELGVLEVADVVVRVMSVLTSLLRLMIGAIDTSSQPGGASPRKTTEKRSFEVTQKDALPKVREVSFALQGYGSMGGLEKSINADALMALSAPTYCLPLIK